MANLPTLERDSAHAVNYLTPRTLNLKEITDPIKRLIYIVNTKGEILSIRDYKGNILAKDGSYIDALESDVYRRWKAQHDASLEK
jgi:hypothetical protein